ncbi:MAG: hypothetical protein GY870_22485 [archaeon]|nr:hypothetical protein [archaeon]
MSDDQNNQLANHIDTRNSKCVISFVKKIFTYHYDKKSFKDVEKCYKKIEKLFEGKFSGYKACNTEYHNLKHTHETLISTAVLIDGFNLENKELPVHLAKDLLIAALFHNTGYIQEKWDNNGTGAKHVEGNVGRSIAFLVKHNKDYGISQDDVSVISKIIRCTGHNVRLKSIPFCSEEEEITGWIFGSAHILGQMSDREYLERLLFLYNEFKEAGIPGYKTEFDIIKNTLEYYEAIKKGLSISFKDVCNYAKNHFKVRYGIDKNLYMDAINKNIAYIEKIIEDNSTNFRSKLKRWEQVPAIDKKVAIEVS